MGPFEEKGKIMHSVVDSMQCINRKLDIYMYKREYITKEYSHMHRYYSNYYIRRDNADVLTIDCYIMCSRTFTKYRIPTVEWYVKVPGSVDEYTHCMPSDELMNDQGKYDKFIKPAKPQKYIPDSMFFWFRLKRSPEKTHLLDRMGCRK